MGETPGPIYRWEEVMQAVPQMFPEYKTEAYATVFAFEGTFHHSQITCNGHFRLPCLWQVFERAW